MYNNKLHFWLIVWSDDNDYGQRIIITWLWGIADGFPHSQSQIGKKRNSNKSRKVKKLE